METLGDIGELGLIARVAERVRRAGGPPAPDGPGDDAAVLASGDVVTTDLLVEGVHFRRDWSGAGDVGTKAAAANLADVVAMGARPTSLLVALGAPASTSVRWLEELTDALIAEAARGGAHLIGGDVSAADGIVLGVTALGHLDGPAVTRSGARPGDLVVLAGVLGWSGAGLRALQAGVPDSLFVQAHRRPQPPYELGLALAVAGATAMIDSSDGAATDLGHLCRASGVGIDLDLSGLVGGGIFAEDVLSGGEDHSFLATVSSSAVLPDGVRIIGRVVEGDRVLVDGREVGSGWQHHRGS